MKTLFITTIKTNGDVETWTFRPGVRLHLELLAATVIDALENSSTVNITPPPPIQ